VQVDTKTTKTDKLDAKDCFEELDVEKQNAVNTALKASISVRIKNKINVNQLRAKCTLR
jgi:hypothetical protein